MHLPQTLLLTLLALSPSALAGLFSSHGDVKVLSTRQLTKHLKSTNKATMVAFYAPWCGYCKQLRPQYEKAATNVRNLVHMVAVDCDADENKAACSTEHEVKGFPTIKYFPGVPHGKDYQGERTAKAMVDQALAGMPTFARKVKSRADLDSLIGKATPEKPLAVLFTKTKLTTPLYKALSAHFHRSIDTYTAHESAIGAGTSDSYGAPTVPTLILFTSSDPSTGRRKYEGKLSYDGIAAFLTEGLEAGKGGAAGKATGEL